MNRHTRRQILICAMLPLLALGSIIFCWVSRLVAADILETDQPVKPPVDMRMAVIYKTQHLSINCKVTNSSAVPFETTEFQSMRNGIFILAPSGRVISAFPYGKSEKVIIAPKETVNWTLDLSSRMGDSQHYAPGEYQVYWEMNGFKSNIIPIVIVGE